jgi:hypothetical protein
MEELDEIIEEIIVAMARLAREKINDQLLSRLSVILPELAKERGQIIERCAKACEANKSAIECRADKWKHEFANAVRDECAASIRALA